MPSARRLWCERRATCTAASRRWRYATSRWCDARSTGSGACCSSLGYGGYSDVAAATASAGRSSRRRHRRRELQEARDRQAIGALEAVEPIEHRQEVPVPLFAHPLPNAPNKRDALTTPCGRSAERGRRARVQRRVRGESLQPSDELIDRPRVHPTACVRTCTIPRRPLCRSRTRAARAALYARKTRLRLRDRRWAVRPEPPPHPANRQSPPPPQQRQARSGRLCEREKRKRALSVWRAAARRTIAASVNMVGGDGCHSRSELRSR
jgi:hypothetical protein